MLSTLVLLVAVSQSPNVAYFPAADRVAWQLAHYKHTHPVTGRTIVSPSPSDEYHLPRLWSQLTPAQQMLPEYRSWWMAANLWNPATQTWSPDPSPRITDPIVFLRVVRVGVQLVPGDPIDEALTDRRLLFGFGY